MPHPLRTAPAVAAAVVAVCVAVALAAAGPDAARAASGDDERVTYYVVQPGPEGEQEYLFQIAQRLLGDGNRYEEIFALNEGRTQPDGNVLTDPASVLPGWVLVLPDDARGEGVQVGVLPQGSTGADAEAQGSTASDPAAVPYYVIGRTPEGETEYLYLVAERFLGDGERHPEIFALNEGRAQPDGGVLTDPEVVEVGWVLQLPADAAGEGLRYGPLPGPSPTAGVSAPPSATAEDPAAAAAEGTAGVPAPWATAALVGAGAVLLAAAVAGVLLLVRRRRAGRAEPFDDSLLRTDTSAAWMVDRALRVLLAACERDGLDLPVVTGVFVEGATMRLRLGSPASPAPAPWGANEDGQSWSAPLARLQSAPASEGSTAPFARLVTIGVGETGRVLVDFAAARGVISLDGPTRARHEVLRRWLGELTGNPWSDDPRVVMVGNGLPQPEHAEHLPAIEQVVPELDGLHGGVLVLSHAPSAAQQDLLAARFADPRFGWVVVVLGEYASARWRLTATEDGWLRSGFLPDVRYAEQTAVRRGGE